MDGEMRGEEHSPAPKAEGHHVRRCWVTEAQTAASYIDPALSTEEGPQDSYYT